jgi:hypothetical protein
MPVREKLAKLKELSFPSSTIEHIDESMLDYLNNQMDLRTTTGKGWKKVPVVWVGAERAFQSKEDKAIRDPDGSLILPIVTVERTGMIKSPTKKGSVWANILPVRDAKGGAIPVARRIKQDKTGAFANRHAKKKRGQINFPTANERIVYETVTIPLPVYVTVTYEIILSTEYQQQMNELVSPFVTTPGGINYVLLNSKDNHRYEGFIQENFDYDNNIANFTSEERKYKTKITIEVLGYLIGEGKNQDQPNIVVRENAVEVKIPRERIIFGDKAEHERGIYYGLPGLEDIE